MWDIQDAVCTSLAEELNNSNASNVEEGSNPAESTETTFKSHFLDG